MQRFYAHLDDRVNFETKGTHPYLDITQHGVHSEIDQNELQNDEIGLWLERKVLKYWRKKLRLSLYDQQSPTAITEDKGCVKTRLRVLICVAENHMETEVVSIPVSKDIFVKFSEKYDIDPAILGYLVTEGVLITQFNAFEGGFGILAILKHKHIVITYDPATSTTYVLARTTCSHQARSFVALLKTLYLESPTVAAIIISWISEILQLRSYIVQDRNSTLLTIEHDLGLHAGFEAKFNRLDRKDLVKMTQKLMILKNPADATALGFIMQLIDIFSDLREHSAIESLICQPLPSRKVRDRFREARELTHGLQTKRQELDQRADILLQMMYHLRSQLINEHLASMADATQRDSAAQIEIAMSTRKLAVRAHLDGANMKAIALINLCCSPATLAATLFGTNFFNFHLNESSEIVSPWIWLFGVLTVTLTAVLYAAWEILYRKMQDPELGYTTSSDCDTGERLSQRPHNAPQTSRRMTPTPDSDNSSWSDEEDIDPNEFHNTSVGAFPPSPFVPSYFPGKQMERPLKQDQCPICFAMPDWKP